jgi:hypothetical protein
MTDFNYLLPPPYYLAPHILLKFKRRFKLYRNIFILKLNVILHATQSHS